MAKSSTAADASHEVSKPKAETRSAPASRVSKKKHAAGFSFRDVPPQILACGIAIGAVFLWSYWPTILELLKTWDKEPDYSHGYLVVPLALYALWTRKDTMPEISATWHWPGLILIGASCVLRWVGARFFLGAIDGWSILLWVAGAVWLLGGWRLLKWALPGVIFLWFMIPMPHQLEHMFRDPLQRVATRASTAVLQCLGQPALAEGNIVRMGEEELLIAEACSGLRIFVAIAVLAFAYIMIVRPVWWERIVLVLAVLPIAMISNVARIVVTGLIYQVTKNEDIRHRWHDYAGFFMIPFAAALFAFLLWYLSKLVREVEPETMSASYRHRATG